MMAEIIDGKAIAKNIREGLKDRCAKLVERGVTPCLAVVLVGDDPASAIYVRNKEKACAQVGIRSVSVRLSSDTQQDALEAQIHALNADAGVDGILVQLPLPPGLDADRVLTIIDPRKDVDGFHVQSMGALVTGGRGFVPCTPKGCMELIRQTGVSLAGKEAVVVGRSNIVGKPMALLLLAESATVTICHSRTTDLAAHTRRADVLVAAVGRPQMINGGMVKPGAIVIDVGINRLPDGRVVGDVDFESVSGVAGYVTPVPGGVGPMTIAMLLENTLLSAEQRA